MVQQQLISNEYYDFFGGQVFINPGLQIKEVKTKTGQAIGTVVGKDSGIAQFAKGIALGAYGLTQAILQIPFGWLSDRIGRKPVIYLGLVLFAIGSFIAATAIDIYWVIAGRVIQGAGAISAAIMALAADLTREEHRTKAMAMIDMTIGATFAISLMIAPLLNQWIGVPRIFIMTGLLAISAIIVVHKIIPNPITRRFHSDAEVSTSRFSTALHHPELLRLNYTVRPAYFSLYTRSESNSILAPF